MRALVLFLILAAPPAYASEALEAATFASIPHEVFVPVREAAKALGWSMEYDDLVELMKLKGHALDPFRPRLSDGTWLISLDELAKLGATVRGSRVYAGDKSFEFYIGPKRVEIDLKSQWLKAWQGDRLIFRWQVSSGREGKDTPRGDFRALEKEAMHISKIYGSPMPFSIHVTGNIYIHGSDRFSDTPGSHGCIRLPLMETRNIAEEFYNWIDLGTPIRIRGAYDFKKASNPGSRTSSTHTAKPHQPPPAMVCHPEEAASTPACDGLSSLELSEERAK